MAAFDNPDERTRFFFKGQLLHLLLLTVLLVAPFLLVDFPQLRASQLFGLSTQAWFVISLAVPIIHQVFTWFIWRSELCFGSVTKRLGSRAFVLYQTLFLILLLFRPLSVTILAISDYDSLDLSVPIRIIVGSVLAIPALYTFYSVARYFGLARAAGIDHFDPNYRNLPQVTEGIFRFSGNAMYVFGFLILWAIAIGIGSWTALVAAAFNHAYIWVHFLCTERPDMNVIYGVQIAAQRTTENPQTSDNAD